MITTSFTISIIDDDKSICDALRGLFESLHYNVNTYEDAYQFLDKYKTNSPGCIIMDVRLPGMSGLELLEQLKIQKIHIPAIVVTGYGDIQMATRAMKCGAKDFILKPFNDQCLLETVQKCLMNSQDMNWIDTINERIRSLTERECQVLHLIIEGKLNKQIADELSISISTVEAHRSNIMHKMQAKNLAQLIRFYLEAQFANQYAQ
jgi:two-component system response regulator FixJ